MDAYFGKMDRSVIVSSYTIRIFSVWIYQLQGHRIKSLTMKQPCYDFENLSAVESLRLSLDGRPQKYNSESKPSSLSSLTEITLSGESHRGGARQNQTENKGKVVMSETIKTVYLSGSIWFRNPQLWLAPFADTIRYLNLYSVKTSHSVRNLTFPHLEIIESHWCSPCILQGGRYPSLRKYSESVVLTGCDKQLILSAIKDYLYQIDTLAVRAECSRFLGRGGLECCSVDLQQIFSDLLLAQASGVLKSCFVDGSFSNIPVEVPHWLFLLGPMKSKDFKERSEERHKMLRRIDPLGHFWETNSSKITHLDEVDEEQ